MLVISKNINFDVGKFIKNRRYMVKHIVCFKLSGSDEERREIALRFKNALMELPSKIDVLKSMEVGINENPSEDWDVVLTAVVGSMDVVGI